MYARVYLWALNSVPLVYVSIFMPISHCLDYYTFILGLKIEYSTLVFINGKKRERKRETRDNSIRRCYNKVQKQDLNPCLSDSSARSKTIFLPGDYWSVPLAGP